VGKEFYHYNFFMRIPYPVQAIIVTACWGGNFVAARLVLDFLPPFCLLSLRFIITAAVLIPFFPRPPTNLRLLFLFSMLLGVTHFSLLYGSLYMGLDVSSAVISSQLGVPFSCLLGSILLKDRIGRWRSLGMLASFIGILIICGSPRIVQQYVPFLIACAGAFMWAASNIVVKRMGSNINMLGVLAWMSLFSVPQLAFISWVVEDGQMEAVGRATLQTWVALSYTVLMSTILAYGLWYSLMRRYPISHIVPYSLLVPIFGLGFAQAFFAEPMTWQFIIGGILTVAGVAIIVFRKPENAARDPV
jgi:O-acetylserine/cysteine efflux transporter